MKSPDGEYGPSPVSLACGRHGTGAVRIEAWVCQACGFTDLYAKDLELLLELAESDADVQVVDRATKQGPFR